MYCRLLPAYVWIEGEFAVNGRFFIEPDDSFEEGLTAVVDDRGIRLSIAEEKAYSTDEVSVNCSIHLTPEKALMLCEWLYQTAHELVRKPFLSGDPRYARVLELVRENPPPDGVRAVIPRVFYREAGFTDEEIDAQHSLGKNLK